jgi:hypothetical protein
MKFMKIHSVTKNLFFAVLTSSIFALSLTGCSDSNKDKVESKAAVKTVFNPFDHSKDEPVTATEKHKFHDAFAAQCVARETKNSVNKEEDTERFTKSCECVTTFMLKDLTDEEVEKYLSEHENPRSLQIKFNSAAYHCAQQQPISKGFTVYQKPESAKKEDGFFNKLF